MTYVARNSDKTSRPAFGRVVFLLIALALAAGFFMPHGVRAAGGYLVQGNVATGSGTSCSVAFNSNNTRGNLIIVSFGTTPLAAGGAVSDTQGNTYALSSQQGALGGTAATRYAQYIKAGANTVTITFGISATNYVCAIHEYSGLKVNSPLDQSRSSSGTSSSPDSGSINNPTSQNNELLYGFTYTPNASVTFTAGTNFTLHESASQGTSEDQNVNTVGTYNATFSLSASADWIAQVATFRAADVGVQVSSRSDTLSDSRPSATSNHTIAFTTNTAVAGSSTIILTLANGFGNLGTLDCGDVDAATSSQFNFNYPGCQATATAWGWSFSGTDNTFTLRAPTDSTSTVHVATGTPITINIGSSATSQQQGVHWIKNPSTAGIYTIQVGGTFGGSGNMLVSINSGVTVQATVAESLALTVSSVKAVNCTADDGATVTAIDTSPTTVSFGTVPLNTFYIACQDLVVSTNAGNGYSLTTQESSAMQTVDGRFTIPDTTCDAGGCTESAAAAWTNATKNGLGHTCFNQDGNHDCNAAYSNGTNFRQFANIAGGETAQAIMSSSTPASVTARVKYRLSAGLTQVAGAYATVITYIITGTY